MSTSRPLTRATREPTVTAMVRCSEKPEAVRAAGVPLDLAAERRKERAEAAVEAARRALVGRRSKVTGSAARAITVGADSSGLAGVEISGLGSG